ncbi:hypothetical protein E3J74_04570 [Candidatus Bathyarchaeota archaeon]|nr:MAG: hypothetical protein E3J74_04570 [Candidatus Bathyarchaeota archaeon]
MDWTKFDECFGKLKTILRDMLSGNDRNPYKREIYGNYLGYGSDVKFIIQRIEAEIQKSMEINEKLHAYARARIISTVRGEEESEGKLVMEGDRMFRLLTLDIKSFFIFTRIFLDTLARIVRLHFSEKGGQLPWDMKKLVRSEKLKELDSDFAEGLKEKMLWIDSFVDHRVEIEHYLGSIPSATMKNGKFGFDILGSRDRRSGGTHAIESITNYIEDVLSNVSEVMLYIYQKFHSVS